MRCPYPRWVWPNGKVIAVPCGKCLFCLVNKRNDWTMRLQEEQKRSESAFFVTLTYSDKFLPDCGLVKRHLQLYFKRLRKVTPRLRYFAVGEYGSKTQRAHYHAIIFNAEEKAIREKWTLYDKVKDREYPIGIVHVGTVTEASCAYVTKYCIQKGLEIDGLNKPFSIMSRGYGLGAWYLSDEMIEWHRADDRNYTLRYGVKGRLPRYYKDKIWPNSDWSNWKYRREQVNAKAKNQADLVEEAEIKLLSEQGYNPEVIRKKMRDAIESRIMVKVSFSQIF